MKTNHVPIDVEALDKWIRAQPHTNKEIAANIGKCGTFFSDVKRAGHMKPLVYNLFINTYNLPEGSFIKKEPEPAKETKPVSKKSGYWTELEVMPDKVNLTLWFSANGADIEVAHAFSKVKGNRELDLVQAISYAAHMIYKIVEQKELGK